MTSPFNQQANFMELGGQTTGTLNLEQAERYLSHILEEAEELRHAWDMYDYDAEHAVKVVDGAVDTIVVCIGFLHSLGVDPQKAWDAVHRANMSKFENGKPVFRVDGQIGKGRFFKPPDEELEILVKAAGMIHEDLT